MKVTKPVIQSESVAVGLRGKSVTRGDDELIMAEAPEQILQSALSDLSEGRVSEALEQFGDRFTFNDHALKLEFTDKTRLIEFLEKCRELFPDATMEIGCLFGSGDYALAEWRFSATESVPLVSVSHRIPISFQGSTIVRVENGKIVRWSEYYDQGSYLPIRLGAFFTEWAKF